MIDGARSLLKNRLDRISEVSHIVVDMARKNIERGGSKSPSKSLLGTPRASPVRARSPEGGSPRSSPGLAGGHYAGCKWTEPPLPSSLPPPPQHWMQAAHPSFVALRPFHAPKSECDMAGQLKMLLKVQA